jgi:tRNA-uridine aminocarboxypropyltransferase
MSRRDNAEARCRLCRMHQVLCVCALLPRLETRTRLVLVIHRYEARKPTNSGLLGASCLVNSQVLIRGGQHGDQPRLAEDAGRQPLLLFPSEQAVPIGEYADSPRPVTLVVPDGTWRQASKVPSRLPGIEGVPLVSLPKDAPTNYQLRSEFHPGRLATLEAIARALGILEGAHIRQALEQVFRIMVDRTLWMRGALRADEVTGGIPASALENDPRGGLALSAPARGPSIGHGS